MKMVKYYTIDEDRKLVSLDALPINGDYRVVQETTRGGTFIPASNQEKIANFRILRRSSTVASITFPTITFETSPFSIVGVGTTYCVLLIAIYENVDHLGMRVALGTDWSHRIVKQYDLRTGLEENVNDYDYIPVVYTIKKIELNGLHLIIRFSYQNTTCNLYLSKAQSGVDNPVYSYNLNTTAPGAADFDYYDVDADIIHSMGGGSSDSDVAQHALAVAEASRQIASQANATADAAMTAINLANLDDKISV